jgi:ABC-2 type transport system ATP-binding protein
MSAAVEIRNLSHKYGERLALDGVSFSVEAGQMFALVGPNGGGKSTLFRILSTLLKPWQGEVRVFGADVVREPREVRCRIGVVFQSPALDKKLTLLENLQHQGHLYGMSGRPLADRIDRLLTSIGLADRKTEKVETLSGGLKRRVEIAKGLVPSPSLILLDEPTTGLDPLARREVWDLLRSLRARDGLTVLTTTHLLEEAEACSQVALLNAGRLVAAGSPDALRDSLGGDVISLRGRDSDRLKAGIESRFGVAAAVVDGFVRLERKAGHEFVPALVTAFPDEIQSVTVSKPTLEDFFIEKTGTRFGGSTELAR